MSTAFWEAMCERRILWYAFVTMSGTFLVLLLGSALLVDYDRSTRIIWAVTVAINGVVVAGALGILLRCRARR